MIKENEYEDQQIELVSRLFNIFNSKIRSNKDSKEAIEYAITKIEPLIIQTIQLIIQQNRDFEKETRELIHHYSHEIYAVYSKDGECLYVGSGKLGRSKHCTSGRSHVPELNRCHFNDEIDEVVIIADDLTKDTSLKLERVLIHHLKPCFNRMHNRCV